MKQIAKSFSKLETKEIKYNYYVYLLEGYSETSAEKWPLILFLHGAGERGDSPQDVEKVKANGLPKVVEAMEDFPFVVVSPQCPSYTWWPREVDRLSIFLDEIIAANNIDSKKVIITGLSMGGFGTWNMCLAYPEKFAAAAPVCGGGLAWNAEMMKEVPVWAFHGAKDDVVSISESESMVNALKKLGADVKFTVYPEADHDSWTETYNNPELYQWFLEKIESK